MKISYLSSNHNHTGGLHCCPPSGRACATDYTKQPISAVRAEKSNQLDEHEALPTVLVAAEEELRSAIVPALEAAGYLVFTARNEAEALHFVVTHSRSIHILLADIDMNGNKLARALMCYRFEMRAFLITNQSHNDPNALTPAAAVAKVRQDLRLPKGIVAQVGSNERARAQATGRTA